SRPNVLALRVRDSHGAGREKWQAPRPRTDVGGCRGRALFLRWGGINAANGTLPQTVSIWQARAQGERESREASACRPGRLAVAWRLVQRPPRPEARDRLAENSPDRLSAVPSSLPCGLLRASSRGQP